MCHAFRLEDPRKTTYCQVQSKARSQSAAASLESLLEHRTEIPIGMQSLSWFQGLGQKRRHGIPDGKCLLLDHRWGVERSDTDRCADTKYQSNHYK